MKLKMLTLNLHCFAEKDIRDKQITVVEEIISKEIDIIFLQEVAQTRGSLISEDNYALSLINLLSIKGHNYKLYYEGFKKSFDIYEEGLAVISRFELIPKKSQLISKTDNYDDWKTRKILSFDLEEFKERITIATTHFGWSDGYEVFEEQFDEGGKCLDKQNLVILAGDFNVSPESKEYNYIIDKGWVDLSNDDSDFYNRPTFKGDNNSNEGGTRLDYIMTNKLVEVIEKSILFTENCVSDHYGLYMCINI